MKVAPAAEVKAHLSVYLEQCKDGPVIVVENDRPVAALISVQEGEELERLVLAHTPKFRRLLEAAEQRIRHTGGARHEDFWQSLEAAE